MSGNKCAREGCGKTVYPLEELKCLDKVWHKICFKCTTCGMALNMKTYKGYEKKPYCDAHYPKTVASVVADTPEMRRLAENTKFQSQVQYHAEYEKMRGTKIEIADDPELQRHLANTKAQSQVQYHNESEKKRQQEAHRPGQHLTSTIEQQQPQEQVSATHFHAATTNGNGNGLHSIPNAGAIGSIYTRSPVRISYDESEENEPEYAMQHSTASKQHQNVWGNSNDSPYSQRLAQQAGSVAAVYGENHAGRVPPEPRQVGSISDYDPMNGQWGTGAAAGTTVGKTNAISAEKSAGKVGSASPLKQKTSTKQQEPAAATAPVSRNTGFSVKALYDYTAADKDEVSFKENDVIVNCQKVDEGWMTGTVQRTLMWGMLPANYVEKVNQPTGLFKLS